MTASPAFTNEETLDPADWESMRQLGHRMIDDMVDHMKTLDEQPVWRHAPNNVREHFENTAPLEPQAAAEVYDEFLQYILPYPMGVSHPRFWGWVAGTGTMMGAYGELLSAAMNSPSGAFAYHSSNYVEDQVINWFKEIMGFPARASGVLTSGCSAANLIALAVARNVMAGYDLRAKGAGAKPGRMTLYASQEIHSSIQRAVELLGLGSEALRTVPVDDHFQINLQALQEMIAQDRSRGDRPFCVVGAAGTTSTGAIDDLEALADLCQEEGLWYHVDGAFGAWAVLAPEKKDLLIGMERADSLAFDLHKWMYMPYVIGGVLVRSEEDHRKTFSLTPAYLAHGIGQRGLTGVERPWLSDYSFELSRDFKALKAWMSLKEHGIRKYGRLIQQNIDQAHYLATLVETEPQLELAAPVTLNVVCFRYVSAGLTDVDLNGLNKQVEIELQERGIAAPSITQIDGKDVFHVAITNHRTRRQDLDLLVREIIAIAKAQNKL